MESFRKKYSKLFIERENSNFIERMEKIITQLEPNKNEKYKRNCKHTIKEYVCGIIEVISNNISWRKYTGKIDGRVLNNKHNHYCKIGVYDGIYKLILGEYLTENKEEKIKVLSIDSTFIENKNGIDGTSITKIREDEK